MDLFLITRWFMDHMQEMSSGREEKKMQNEVMELAD